MYIYVCTPHSLHDAIFFGSKPVPKIFIMRKYKKVIGSKKKRYGDYTQDAIKNAIVAIQEGNMSIREASSSFNIPKSTLHRKLKGIQLRPIGHPPSLSPEEERSFVQHLIVVAEWGFPFSNLDLRLMVKAYLDKANRRVSQFKNNIPGEDWARSFLKRHSNELSHRHCQNIKRSRAEMKKEDFENYFENLSQVITNVPPENILNYDETNLSDDPGQEKLIFKRGKKYPERIQNYSKGSISIMFAGTATGELLPSYVVYKAANLWNTWTTGGPPKTRYNRSKSGWFDAICFDDWFRSIILPWARKTEGPKVMIGDNLSSHFSSDVLDLCEQKNISFVCLVPNSTHLSQPLDVAFYGPLKRKWRKILKEWKLQNTGQATLPKDAFPRLLKELEESLNVKNLVSGFKTCGIYPLNAQELLRKLPSQSLPEDINNSVSNVVLEQLKSMRGPTENIKAPRRKKIAVEPGKSISSRDLESSDSEESEGDSSEESEAGSSEESEADSSEEGNSISDPERSDDAKEMEIETTPVGATSLKELTYDNVSTGQWVKVLYEDEVFLGKVQRKVNNECCVQCLEKPFGVKEPQSLEKDSRAVFYEKVYETDVQPKLTKVGRGWKYTY